MACFHPVDAFQRDDGSITLSERGNIARSIRLRCRYCIGCRRDHQQAWAARILHESQMHSENWFVTLTYDDAHLPLDGSLRYRHFQLFMRYLRRARGKVRFFMSGEYGTKLNRPHYHAIFFGLRLDDLAYHAKSPQGNTLWRSDFLNDLWGKGFCVIGSVTQESAAYVASYVNKKVTGPRAPDHYLGVHRDTGEIIQRRPEFARMSLKPGIGSTWLDKFESDVFPRDHVLIHDRKFPVPVYYQRILKKRHPFKFEEIEHDRFLAAQPRIAESSPSRLAAREAVLASRLNLSRRTI